MFQIIPDMVLARREKGMSQTDLACAVGVDRQSISRLEREVGSLSLLGRVMQALDYHVIGLAAGSTFVEQLGNRRRTLGYSMGELALRTGVSRPTVAAVEAGESSISSAMAVLKVLGTRRMGRRKPQMIPLTPINAAERDKRFTPLHFLDAISKVWGEIDLDPCGHLESPVIAKQRIILDEGGNGLRDHWSGRLVYMNPPFSQSVKWLQRADHMWASGQVEIVVALVPARTDGAYFHDRLSRVCDIALLRGRFQFSRGEGQQDRATRAPFPLMVLVWGASPDELAEFGVLCPCIWLRKR